MVKIAPSLLACDFGNLAAEVKAVEAGGADLHHIDIMDGHFVPNLSFGLPVCEAIGKAASIPLDVHLMIEPYEPYLEAFRDIGAARIAVHVEAGPHPHRALQAIRAMGLKSGLALNPGTPVETVAPLLSVCDQVVVMSVNPGFGGQKFIPETLERVAAIKTIQDKGFGQVDYLAYRRADDLSIPKEHLKEDEGRLLVAAWLGKTRLIDNISA